MTYKDYYKDLGVGASATAGEIKKAYRTMAKKYHPDKTRGDSAAEDKFKEINEAHDVLSDPVKRKKYDQFGADWKHYEEAGAQPGGFDWSKYSSGTPRNGGTGQTSGGPAFEDLFEMLFGQTGTQGGRQRSVVRPGEDIEAGITLSLEEAYNGTLRYVQVHDETIKVTIKPGVTDQQTLRVTGKGGRGRGGGPNGNLYLTIAIARHPLYRRTAKDLHRVLPVELYTAVLGGKTSVDTLKGKVKVNIPRGTPNGKELRLRGLGMPDYARKNAFGDLMVTVDVVLPDNLNDHETDLFRKLAAIRHFSGILCGVTMETDDDMTDSGGPQAASSFDKLLADEYILYTKTRDAHWMIQGRNVLDLHMVIEHQYCTLDMIVGDLVERAHALGSAGLGSFKDCMAITRLRGHDLVCRDPRRILRELLLDHEMVIRRLRRDILVAGEEQRDSTMVKFLSGVMKHHQNMLDMLTVRMS